MNQTTEIVLEYLSPQLAAEMMTRLHASLPDDEKERRAQLNQVHRELREHQERVARLATTT